MGVNEKNIIDLDEGARLAGGNRQIAMSMLQELHKTLPEHLQRIHAAVLQQDYECLYDATHRLYGGLCYCGAPQLRECVAQLKQACLEGNKNLQAHWDQLTVTVQRFNEQWQALC